MRKFISRVLFPEVFRQRDAMQAELEMLKIDHAYEQLIARMRENGQQIPVFWSVADIKAVCPPGVAVILEEPGLIKLGWIKSQP